MDKKKKTGLRRICKQEGCVWARRVGTSSKQNNSFHIKIYLTIAIASNEEQHLSYELFLLFPTEEK